MGSAAREKITRFTATEVSPADGWVEGNKTSRNTHLWVWVLGFVSGAGYSSPKLLRETDSDALAAWIDKYCAEHPLDMVAKASSALVAELERKQ